MSERYKQKLLDLIIEVEVFLSHLKKDVEMGSYSANTMGLIVEVANRMPILIYNLTKLKYNTQIVEDDSISDNRKQGKW